MQPDFVVDITPYWPAKRRSLECYASQFITGREDLKPSVIDRVETHCAYFGHLVGAEYGEPFACREPIGLTALTSLV